MCLQDEFYPKSLEYIPERWIKGHEMESKAHPYVMLPFGFGPRMCIGRRLAEMEMWQLTAKVLQILNEESTALVIFVNVLISSCKISESNTITKTLAASSGSSMLLTSLYD